MSDANTYELKVEAGKRYCWCACGLSQKFPMCDGSHQGTGMKSVPFIPEEDGVMQLCACGKTSNPPECDSQGCLG